MNRNTNHTHEVHTVTMDIFGPLGGGCRIYAFRLMAFAGDPNEVLSDGADPRPIVEPCSSNHVENTRGLCFFKFWEEQEPLIPDNANWREVYRVFTPKDAHDRTLKLTVLLFVNCRPRSALKRSRRKEHRGGERNCCLQARVDFWREVTLRHATRF